MENSEDLETELEQDETPYVEFDISVSPSDPTLELLSNQLNNEDIIIPFYQRKYVWKIEQASKLVESFLMGLPVPQIFMYVNNDDQLEVIDGQQRLKSINYFFEGYFGESDNQGRRKIFRLKGLSERSEYNGKTFEDLSTRDQRRLRNSTLRAINIKQLKPNDEAESVFHIFERLNTGGTHLKPQEIRNAVYRGNIVNQLWDLNENENWQKILKLKNPDKSQKDVELILRLFSLFENWQNYEKPMLRWLNKYMSINRDFDNSKAERFKTEFSRATKIINENIERPFRPKNVINSAVLEAVTIAIMEDSSISSDTLSENYEKLLQNNDFIEHISGPTTDTAVLKRRIEVAKENFNG